MDESAVPTGLRTLVEIRCGHMERGRQCRRPIVRICADSNGRLVVVQARRRERKDVPLEVDPEAFAFRQHHRLLAFRPNERGADTIVSGECRDHGWIRPPYEVIVDVLDRARRQGAHLPVVIRWPESAGSVASRPVRR
jgi:hypothetical protein